MKHIKTFENTHKVNLQKELYDIVSNPKNNVAKKNSIIGYKLKKQLKELINLGVDINEPYDIRGGFELPLWIAIHEENFYVAELLINAGADVNKLINKYYL